MFLLQHSAHKKIIISIGLLIITMLILGIPFTQWGFLHDDWGIIYHARTTGNHLATLFTEGSMTTVHQPVNYLIPEQSFLAVLYRPFVYLFLYLQMLAVGAAPYPLFLITIFFHGLNAALLFNLLCFWITLPQALCAALLFVSHLSLWDWMGWIAGQNQVVNLTLLLVIALLLQHDKTKESGWKPIMITLLFFVSLFYREEAIILPIWLLCCRSWLTTRISTFLGLTTATVIYLGTRLLFFPFKVAGTGVKGHILLSNFLYSLKNRFFDLVTLLADLTNLAWLPGGHRWLKGSLILLILTIACWLFVKNRKKGQFIKLGISSLLFMWPAVWRYYSSRFLYLSLPFVVVALVLLITEYQDIRKKTVMMLGILCVIISAGNFVLLHYHFRQREQELSVVNQAYKDLAQHSMINNKHICFIGIPYAWGVTGMAQAIWLNGVPTTQQIYYDNTTFVWSNNITQASILIEPIEAGWKLSTKNPATGWFLITNQCMPMGQKQAIVYANNIITSMDYQIDRCYLSPEHIWITWDYANNRFKQICLFKK